MRTHVLQEHAAECIGVPADPQQHHQPDESRCLKSLLRLSEQVGSSRSTEKLQNDVHNSIKLISKILSHGEAARWCPDVGVPAVEERAAKRYRRYSRMLRGTCVTPRFR